MYRFGYSQLEKGWRHLINDIIISFSSFYLRQKMAPTLRHKSKVNYAESDDVAPLKEAVKVKKQKVSKKTFPFHRPSFPIADAKVQVLKELGKVGSAKPSQVKTKLAETKRQSSKQFKILTNANFDFESSGSKMPLENLNKSILAQVQKLSYLTPSIVKSNIKQGPFKMTVQTEILKNALVSELKRLPPKKSPVKGR